jgi:hypothetical protein
MPNGNEGVMARTEQEGLPHLFRLRATANMKRAPERAVAERDWSDAGQGWQGKETNLRLMGGGGNDGWFNCAASSIDRWRYWIAPIPGNRCSVLPRCSAANGRSS